MKIDGAKNIIARLDYYVNKLGTDALNSVTEKALKILKQKYKSTGHNDYICGILKGENSSRIYVKGKDVLFTEYGTGYEGQGTYPKAYLPTRTFRFLSANKARTTIGWVYYYPNKNTKRTINGVKGWFNNRKFEVGKPAEKQLYETMKEIRKELKSIIREQIRNNIK